MFCPRAKEALKQSRPQRASRTDEGGKFYTFNLEEWDQSVPELGEEAEPLVTNSPHFAAVIERASCRSSKDVEEAMGKVKDQIGSPMCWDSSNT